jgi:hypothetical protein
MGTPRAPHFCRPSRWHEPEQRPSTSSFRRGKCLGEVFNCPMSPAERGTKTHRSSRCRPPCWPSCESTSSSVSAAIPAPWCSRRHSAIRCGCRTGGRGSGTPSQRNSGSPGGRPPTCSNQSAASLLAQSGVPVTAAAASLGHDPASPRPICTRGDLGAVAMPWTPPGPPSSKRSIRATKKPRMCGLRTLRRAWISLGWPDAAAERHGL